MTDTSAFVSSPKWGSAQLLFSAPKVLVAEVSGVSEAAAWEAWSAPHCSHQTRGASPLGLGNGESWHLGLWLKIWVCPSLFMSSGRQEPVFAFHVPAPLKLRLKLHLCLDAVEITSRLDLWEADTRELLDVQCWVRNLKGWSHLWSNKHQIKLHCSAGCVMF